MRPLLSTGPGIREGGGESPPHYTQPPPPLMTDGSNTRLELFIIGGAGGYP